MEGPERNPDRVREVLDQIRRGGSIEELASGLHWKDFEAFTAHIFCENGFLVKRNFRFSSNKRRYEIDVVAIEKPRVLLVDCKHWGIRPGKSNGIQRAADQQRLRREKFVAKLPLLLTSETAEWRTATTIPLLVTLFHEGISERCGTYIVPVFKLNAFIEEARCGLFDCGRASEIVRLDCYQGTSPISLRSSQPW
ncbi:MAG: restriction endonuclease [Candidatus Verstraetearchaeota archaeon]|nr:restriction endonuclease [Candidatus Verstraetearchaeota archaeon]